MKKRYIDALIEIDLYDDMDVIVASAGDESEDEDGDGGDLDGLSLEPTAVSPASIYGLDYNESNDPSEMETETTEEVEAGELIAPDTDGGF